MTTVLDNVLVVNLILTLTVITFRHVSVNLTGLKPIKSSRNSVKTKSFSEYPTDSEINIQSGYTRNYVTAVLYVRGSLKKSNVKPFPSTDSRHAGTKSS